MMILDDFRMILGWFWDDFSMIVLMCLVILKKHEFDIRKRYLGSNKPDFEVRKRDLW